MKTYVVGETLDRVALDLLGPIPTTSPDMQRHLLYLT